MSQEKDQAERRLFTEPNAARRFFRPAAALLVLVMACTSIVAWTLIQRNIGVDLVGGGPSLVWTAGQMEIEAQRFGKSLALLGPQSSPEAIEKAQEQFDVLWSRSFSPMADRLRQNDTDNVVDATQKFLEEIQGKIANLTNTDLRAVPYIISEIDNLTPEMREDTLRVLRAEGQFEAGARQRLREVELYNSIMCFSTLMVTLVALIALVGTALRSRVTRQARKLGTGWPTAR